MKFENMLKKFSSLQKVKVALVIAPSLFWVIIAMIYITQNKGLSVDQFFGLIGIYYILGIFFEYPTGVIGDYFSHRVSVLLGYIFCGGALLWLLFSSSYVGVFIFYLLYALGGSLIMGNNWALLHSFSRNFKNDLSDVKMFSGLMRGMEMFLAGILVIRFGLEITIYLSIAFFILGFIILLTTKDGVDEQVKYNKGNIFIFGLEGLKKAMSSKYLLGVLLLIGLFGSFFMFIKWLLNPFFIFLNIDLFWWGIIGGVNFLAVSLGSLLYKKLLKNGLLILLFLFIGGFSLLSVKNVAIAVSGLFFFQVVRGILSVKLSVLLNSLIDDKERASLMSLASFLRKIFISLISMIVGYILNLYSFPTVIFVLVLLIIISSGLILFLLFPTNKLLR